MVESSHFKAKPYGKKIPNYNHYTTLRLHHTTNFGHLHYAAYGVASKKCIVQKLKALLCFAFSAHSSVTSIAISKGFNCSG
jgi:hypothetical protein